MLQIIWDLFVSHSPDWLKRKGEEMGGKVRVMTIIGELIVIKVKV